jgi:glycosyltransferase involved in cell wall biosynthesis
LKNLDYVFTCETFYNNQFTKIAKSMNVHTVIHANPEFFDWLQPSFAFIPEPDKVILPSYWHKNMFDRRFNAQVIPTPIFKQDFDDVPQRNMKRTGRDYLFMQGFSAAEDRNGLYSLYAALKHATGTFTVTVKTQGNAPRIIDERVSYDTSAPVDQKSLYDGYDALIMPRRYGGQCMPMTEALYCGLPVIMTDISPNDSVLPKEWLVPAEDTHILQTRIPVMVYNADMKALAEKLDTLDVSQAAKEQARELGMKYDSQALKEKWEKVFA